MLNYPMACKWIGGRRVVPRRDESSGVEGETEKGTSQIKKKRLEGEGWTRRRGGGS